MRIDQQAAYILHTRPYRDNSLLVDIVTADFGKVSLVAKGARKSKQGLGYLLQPFIPVLISWSGNSSLKTLIGIEVYGTAHNLCDKYLYSGLYANELMLYLLPSDDPTCEVISVYQELLDNLEQQADLEISLRRFEYMLLNELGYGVDFYYEAVSGEPLKPEIYYRFIPDQGFLPVDISIQNPQVKRNEHSVYRGDTLLSIALNNFDGKTSRQAAKDISRKAIAFLLNGRELKSREFFKQMLEN
jgi:DNA repair protein RecO (recombination protein O)